MENKNRVCNILNIKYPLVQAAMNWITDANMVAAVSNAGGMGVLGPNAGVKFEGNKRVSTEERYRNELRKIKNLTNNPFAVNVYLPEDGMTEMEAYGENIINIAFEEDVTIFVTVGQVNKKLAKQLKKRNGIWVHRELTPTPEASKLAENEGADIIIATGYDEGGWIPHNKIGTFSIVPTIVDSVQIPVMATGGINDIRGVRAAFALGAEGVYVGTRFILSEECPASDACKQDIIQTKAKDLVFVSGTQRSTPHTFAQKLARMYEDGMSTAELDEKINQIDGLRPGMLEGRLEDGIVSVNTAIDLIKEVKSCEDIVQELMADFIN